MDNKQQKLLLFSKIENSKSYKNFMNGLQSKATQETYRIALQKYMQFLKVKSSPDELITAAKKFHSEREIKEHIQTHLKEFIIELKNQNVITAKSIRLYVFGVITFYALNDVIDDSRTINTKKLWRYLPENHRPIKDRAYTLEEISKLLSNADERLQVIILLMSSAGLRRGALPSLKIGDLSPVENFYKITVYAEYPDDTYETFCTPECRKAIDSYLDLRKRFGEVVTSRSTVIRDSFDLDSEVGARKPKPMSNNAIESLLWRHCYKNGLKTKGVTDPDNKHKHDRTETYIAHSLRKFFESQLITEGKVNVLITNMLLGHNIGLDKSYYKPSTEDIINAYKQALPYITISQEINLSYKVESLEQTKEILEREKVKLTADKIEIEKKLADYDKKIEGSKNLFNEGIATLIDVIKTNPAAATAIKDSGMLKKLEKVVKEKRTN
jgi:integrase